MAPTKAFSFVFANFGMAIVAKSPMITTTMRSSISVKPRRDVKAHPPGAKGRRARRKREPGATYSRRYGPLSQEPCSALRIDPIRSNTDSYDQRNAQLGGTLHMAFYEVRCDLLLPARHLKHKLVMDLQDHVGGETPLAQRAGDADHGDLDEVARRALERRVGRGALAEGADVEVLVLELGDVAAPAEQGLHVPPLARRGDGAIEPGAHAREAGEVLLDEALRVILRDGELAGQGKRSLAVDRGEVDRLRAGSHFRRDLVVRHAEDDRRGLAVNVPALLEGFDERRVAREMGQESQLNLGVVGREQHRAGRSDEGAANGLAARGAHRDVLQVRIG